MRVLTGAVKRRYERIGYVVVPRVFSARECEEIISEVDRIEALGSADTLSVADTPAYQRAGVSKKDAAGRSFIIGELPAHGPLLTSVVSDVRLVAMASSVLGGRGRSAPLRYHFSQVLNKPARIGPRVRWHTDFLNPLISTVASQFCRVMLCLDGMTKSNGPTAFEPRSHLMSDNRARWLRRRKRPRRPYRERLALCPPGSVVLFHPKVRHGGGVNRSAQERRNIIVQWGKAGARLTYSSLERWSGVSPEVLRTTQGV